MARQHGDPSAKAAKSKPKGPTHLLYCVESSGPATMFCMIYTVTYSASRLPSPRWQSLLIHIALRQPSSLNGFITYKCPSPDTGTRWKILSIHELFRTIQNWCNSRRYGRLLESYVHVMSMEPLIVPTLFLPLLGRRQSAPRSVPKSQLANP